jgi:hypothetical protein
MVNLYVRSFEKIDDVKMEFSVQITFRFLSSSLTIFLVLILAGKYEMALDAG